MFEDRGRRWYTATEAAEIIGCTSRHVAFMCRHRKELRAQDVSPKLWLIPESSVKRIAEEDQDRPRGGRPRKGR